MDREQSIAQLNRFISLGKIDSIAECGRTLVQLLSKEAPTSELIEPIRTVIKILHNAGRAIDLVFIYERLVALYPEEMMLRWDLSRCYLSVGDFQAAWFHWAKWRLDWEWRHGSGEFDKSLWWDGSSLQNKTILIRTEQGYGDIIQFARFLPKLKTLGGKIILDLRNFPFLWRLLENCADKIIKNDSDKIIKYDVVNFLLILPAIFQTSLENISSNVPYLTVPVQAGKNVIASIRRYTRKCKCIGLVWATDDEKRSLMLWRLSSLFDIPGIKFFSLQKGIATLETAYFSKDVLIDISSYSEDFADTAAAIQELDLIITIDTAVAHLAGALGRPVWTLIPYAPDWRWLLDREDSPWYPTMRLFRQPKPGDWESVITRVAAELTALVQRQTTTGEDRVLAQDTK